jgi:hypothetical protein
MHISPVLLFAGDRPSKRRCVRPENPRQSSNISSNSASSLGNLLSEDTLELAHLQLQPEQSHAPTVSKRQSKTIKHLSKAEYEQVKAEREREGKIIETVIRGLKNLLDKTVSFPEDKAQTDPTQARFQAVYNLDIQLDKTARQANADMENGNSDAILDKPLDLDETSRRYLQSAHILEPNGRISRLARYIAEVSIEEPEEVENKATQKKERVININPPFATIPNDKGSSYLDIDEKKPLSQAELEREFFGYNPYSKACGVEQLLDASHPHPVEIKALKDLKENLSNPSLIGEISQAYLKATGLLSEKQGKVFVPKLVQRTFETQKDIMIIYKALQDFGANWAEPTKLEPAHQALLTSLGFLKGDKLTKTAEPVDPEKLRHKAAKELLNYLRQGTPISPVSLNYLIPTGIFAADKKAEIFKVTKNAPLEITPEILSERLQRDPKGQLVIPNLTRKTLLQCLSIASNNSNQMVYTHPTRPKKSKRLIEKMS